MLNFLKKIILFLKIIYSFANKIFQLVFLNKKVKIKYDDDILNERFVEIGQSIINNEAVLAICHTNLKDRYGESFKLLSDQNLLNIMKEEIDNIIYKWNKIAFPNIEIAERGIKKHNGNLIKYRKSVLDEIRNSK